jgi:hypothetical protein
LALTVGDAFVGVSPGQWGRQYDTGDRTDAYWTSSDGQTWQIAPILPEDSQRPADLRSHQFEVASLAVVDGAVVGLRALDPVLLVQDGDSWTTLPLPTPDGDVGSPDDGILFLGVAIANGSAGPIVAATLDDSVGYAKTGFVWIRDQSGNWNTATSGHVWDLLDAAAGPAGYVVLAETVEHRFEVWTSSDGVQWITTPIELSSGYAASVIATADGFAIAGGPDVYVSP